jgi:hypothetical protein
MYHERSTERKTGLLGTILKVVGIVIGVLLFCGLIVVTATAIVRRDGIGFPSSNSSKDPMYRPGCKSLPPFSTEIFDTNKDREQVKIISKLIKNGRGIVNGTVVENYSVLIDENGKIKDAGANINPKYEVAELIDAAGKFILPGLVDAHSHLGVYPFPSLWGNSDGNELTDPLTPYVRAIDALNSKDLAINLILRGGVTTSLVLPGSGNVMGGEGVIVKNKQGISNSDMLFPGAPRALKVTVFKFF